MEFNDSQFTVEKTLSKEANLHFKQTFSSIKNTQNVPVHFIGVFYRQERRFVEFV